MVCLITVKKRKDFDDLGKCILIYINFFPCLLVSQKKRQNIQKSAKIKRENL